MIRIIVALLISLPLISHAADGHWKMGPYGPYWDENSWPEFTPMYWMEEFMNQFNNDDDEIKDWYRYNQLLQQFGQPPNGSSLAPYGWQGPVSRQGPTSNGIPYAYTPGAGPRLIPGMRPSVSAPFSYSNRVPYQRQWNRGRSPYRSIPGSSPYSYPYPGASLGRRPNSAYAVPRNRSSSRTSSRRNRRPIPYAYPRYRASESSPNLRNRAPDRRLRALPRSRNRAYPPINRSPR